MLSLRNLRGPMALVLACLGTLGAGCASPEITPLVGEDPEIAALLGRAPTDDPRSSPMAAARRLHQALVQQDTDTVWTLLSQATRRALDERGATISTNGRELIDESTLPGPGGTVRKVRFETLFFGPRLLELEEVPGETGADRRHLIAVSEEGDKTRLELVREEDGWKLEQTGF